jgi:release factor glutamine methyltransferase
MKDSPSTAGGFIRRAARILQTATDSPRLEAEIFLAHALQVTRASLIAHPERRLTSSETALAESLLMSRVSNYPLPYLTGHVEFFGLSVEVTPEVLIPRPDTETLVELGLQKQPRTIIDVGTGSGAIAIALAVHLPQATVYAIDVSSTVLTVAQRNIERHGLTNRVHVIMGDLLAPRPGPVDLIVSNPPYIATDEWASLPPSVRECEPRAALDGGHDGLDIIRRLLPQASSALLPTGALLIEIGWHQGQAATDLARSHFPDAAVRVHADLAGHDRVLEVQL